jgi:hypothetical protein
VKRLLPSLGTLETETVTEFYLVNLTYTVTDRAKTTYLKVEKFKQENGVVLAKVFMRDIDTNRTQICPMPNKLTEMDDFPEISIRKSRGKLITLKEAVELLKSGTTMGLFSDDLTKRLI